MSAKATQTVHGELVFDVSTPSEYKEAENHAEALGLTVADIDAFGSWESDDGHPVFPTGGVEIEKVGRKYFHMVLDDQVVPVRAVDAAGGPGKLRLTFKKKRAY